MVSDQVASMVAGDPTTATVPRRARLVAGTLDYRCLSNNRESIRSASSGGGSQRAQRDESRRK
jgi:hypothetical protein